MLERCVLTRESLETYGALITVADEAEGCRLANRIAPEHLQLATGDPDATLTRIEHAGAVFLGHYTPVAVGDYLAGPNHVLPTGGSARFFSPLGVDDFLKRISVIRYSQGKLKQVAGDLRIIAAKEGLTGHSASVDIRLAPAQPADSNKTTDDSVTMRSAP
jgi:histidinol dehydrogenase